MHAVKPASEEEMVALFLATEYPAPRTRRRILRVLNREGWPQDIIEQPNLGDGQENARRRSVLGAYRGYGLDSDYFEGFPLDTRWERAKLSRQELERVRYIEYEYWIELSGGSRLARDGARNVLAGSEVLGAGNRDAVLLMAEAFRSGVRFPNLILVGKDRESPLVVLEGHMRLTAMFLVPEYIPDELGVMVGFSEQMEDWGCY